MLANHTGMASVLRRIVNLYDRIRKRNAYLHEYTAAMDGMKEQFDTARESVMSVIQEYEAAEKETYLTAGTPNAPAAGSNGADARTDTTGR